MNSRAWKTRTSPSDFFARSVATGTALADSAEPSTASSTFSNTCPNLLAASGLRAGRPGVAGQVGRGLGPAADLQLREDRRHIVLDGLLGQLQPAADLAVRVALGDQGQDALLLRRQPGQALVAEQVLALAQPLQDGGGDRGVEEALALADRADRPDQVGAPYLLQDV